MRAVNGYNSRRAKQLKRYERSSKVTLHEHCVFYAATSRARKRRRVRPASARQSSGVLR